MMVLMDEWLGIVLLHAWQQLMIVMLYPFSLNSKQARIAWTAGQCR